MNEIMSLYSDFKNGFVVGFFNQLALNINIWISRSLMMRHSGAPNHTKEYDDMISSAQNQPGIPELMKAYGQYDLLVRQTAEYLNSIPPKLIIFTSDST